LCSLRNSPRHLSFCPHRPSGFTMAAMTSSSLPSPALFLGNSNNSSNVASTRVVIHPLVLFHILDHHNRRNDAGSRVIGTLLGRRDDETKTVQITNAFSVPHAERGDEVAIGKDFNKTMLQLHLRANRRDTVVGWYATASSEAPEGVLVQEFSSSLIHEFYATETEDRDPIHLVVDPRLSADQILIRAYKSSPIVLQGEVMGNLFHELALSLHGSEPEAIALRSMMAASSPSAPDEPNGNSAAAPTENEATKEALQVSLERLYDLVSATCDYVDKVVDGSLPADPVVGREIADALACVPSADTDAMDRLFHESLQDLLMVTYLSNITQTQVTIAEKLNAAMG
jgi:translation initiation factor 3 subunit F